VGISDAESYATGTSQLLVGSPSGQVSAEMPDEDKPPGSGHQQIVLTGTSGQQHQIYLNGRKFKLIQVTKKVYGVMSVTLFP